MTEYRRRVIELFQRGIPAREIATELGKTVSAINSQIYQARQEGQLPKEDGGRAEFRRRLNQARALRRDVRGWES